MIIRSIQDTWIGYAYDGKSVVACTVSSQYDQTRKVILSCLPQNQPYTITEKGSPFVESQILLIYQLHHGAECTVGFTLATEYYPTNQATILMAASKIPLGYVTTYGNLAKLVDDDARIVGQIMANNPLYPFVPCHRVVGSDFALVGYGGKKTTGALNAKLRRLQQEARNQKPTILHYAGKDVPIHPVEKVLAKAKTQGFQVSDPHQASLTNF